ncbi:MAG: ABC transporter substrate-binding protein [Thermodesulfovibrionales bacterium]|jgi:peptide/nickel transport system substrate-binding protein/oligopeptide transport system substrate-binding protein
MQYLPPIKKPLKKNISALPVFIILIIHALLLSCSSSDRIDGYLYLRLNANPSTLDPALITDLSGGSIAAKLFNGLVKLDETMEIVPDIAENWLLSADGTTYTFYLRKGVFFSNGREVTAQDFKYSFERIMTAGTKSPNTWMLHQVDGAREFREGLQKEIAGIRAPERFIIEIHLVKPFSPFLGMLTIPAASVVPLEEVQRRGGEFSAHPVGTGPFVLKSWNQNTELVLEKNKNYFLEKSILKGIVYKVVPEDLTAVTEFELGNLDLLSLPASAYGRFSEDPKWKASLISLQGLNTYYLGLNTSRPPFDDREVRRAVASALDRKRIMDTFFEGRGRLALGAVPDLLRQWDLSQTLPPYDPVKARQVIKEKGLGGKRVVMYLTTDQEVMDLAEIIQSYLKDIGIIMEIKPLEWTTYKEAVNKGEADLFWLSWWADYPDGENFLFPLFHSSNIGPAGNRTRYRNPSVDGWIEKGRSARLKAEKAFFFRQAEEQVMDDCPLIPFWHKTDYSLSQPWVRGVRSYPIYTMDKGTGLSLLPHELP